MNMFVSRRRMWRVVAGLAVVNALVIFGAFLANGPLRGRGWIASELAWQLNFLSENRVSVWYSGMLLLCVSLAMAACYALETRTTYERSSRLTRFGWLACAAAFAFLSLDEMGSIHERVPEGILPSVAVLAGWTAYLILPILGVAAFFAAFAWYRLRHQPIAALLMALGIILFLTVPLQEHVEMLHFYGDDAPTRPLWMQLVEEGTELFGALAFLAAALLSIAAMSSADSLPHDAPRLLRVEPGLPATILLLSLFGVGMVVSFKVLPTFMDLNDARGTPANWFPSAAAFMIALVLLLRARSFRDRGFIMAARAVVALGVLHIVLSADHGSAHHLSETFLGSNEARRGQVDTLLLLAVLATGAWAVMSISDSVTRVAVAGWTALQTVAYLPGLPERPAIAMVAYAILLPVLVRLSPGRESASVLAARSASLMSDHVATQGGSLGHATYAEHEGGRP